MLPARSAPILFGFILSGLMCLVVSGISTYRAVGMAANFFQLWTSGWIMAWLIGFPLVVVIAPITRRVVQRLVRSPTGT